jgi:hypothetical protein
MFLLRATEERRESEVLGVSDKLIVMGQVFLPLRVSQGSQPAGLPINLPCGYKQDSELFLSLIAIT